MSTKLFERRCVLLIGKVPAKGDFALEPPAALRVEGLDIEFRVEKDLQSSPNNAEISVFNLSAESRAKLEGSGQRVILQAGYEGTEAQIFSGDLRRAFSTKQGPDWVTKIEAGDGERSIAFPRLRESYRPGTSVADVVKKTLRSMGGDSTTAVEKASRLAGEFSSGYAQSGSSSRELTTLLEPLGYTWSVQDGRIEILQEDETVADSAVLVSPESGLVGSPTIAAATKEKKAAVKLRTLLLPRLRPGQKLELRSESMTGVLKALRVTHAGATHGGDWYTDIEAHPL
ncbi:MAG: phage protein [Myxococcota bacterium]